MPSQNKAPITVFIGAVVGLIVVGSMSSTYAILGVIVGAFIGYALGKGVVK